jgi:hypothetical protein
LRHIAVAGARQALSRQARRGCSTAIARHGRGRGESPRRMEFGIAQCRAVSRSSAQFRMARRIRFLAMDRNAAPDTSDT